MERGGHGYSLGGRGGFSSTTLGDFRRGSDRGHVGLGGGLSLSERLG